MDEVKAVLFSSFPFGNRYTYTHIVCSHYVCNKYSHTVQSAAENNTHSQYVLKDSKLLPLLQLLPSSECVQVCAVHVSVALTGKAFFLLAALPHCV